MTDTLPTHVCVLEDDEADAYIISRHLSRCDNRHMQVTVHETYSDARATLAECDVALLDLHLPDLRGLELVQTIRSEFPETPIVIVTALDDDHLARNVVQTGVQDYLVKGSFDSRHIGHIIDFAIERHRMATELKRLNEELRRSLEHIDTLHGLLSICSQCKKIRNREDMWEEVEVYVAKRTDMRFSHGLCPVCYEAVREDLERSQDRLKRQGMPGGDGHSINESRP